ncbi:MAG: hypothetical protein CM15mP129_05390 [Chloroflexota bacterium]|nr:MAG: hypothetical protein CM15mP129_05390 [Chloroflexota bacterium]
MNTCLNRKKELEKFKKEIKTIRQEIKTSGEIKEAKKKIKKIEKTNFKFNGSDTLEYEYRVGDFMQLENISSTAKLIQIKSKNIGIFQIGNSIMELPLSKVLSVVKNYKNKTTTSYNTKIDASDYELDLRGFAVLMLKKF